MLNPGYYQGGKKLRSIKEFEAVIDPLNDPEASRLLRSQEDNYEVGTWCLVGGVLAFSAAGIYLIVTGSGSVSTTPSSSYLVFEDPIPSYTTYPQPQNLTPVWFLSAIGIMGLCSGVHLEDVAGSLQRNAIERYNKGIQPDQNLSMIQLPGTNLLGLGFTQRF